jgi:hypothetical protein
MIQAFRNVWKSARGAVRRNILQDISDDIASNALSNPSYRNAEEYMNAFMRGALTAKENAKIVRTLMNNVGPDTQKTLAQSFVENKSVVSTFSGKNRNQFRTSLKNSGFTDESIRAIEEAWTNNGLRFSPLGRVTSGFFKKLNQLRMSDTGAFMTEFSKALTNSLPNDPFRIAYSNLSRVKWPHKGILSNEEARKRLFMWLVTGQKRLPSELKRDFLRAKGISGSNFKGLVGMSASIAGTWVRTYIAMSLFLTFVTFCIDALRDNRIEGKEIEGDNWLSVLWYRFLESMQLADYSYFVPAVTLNRLLNKYVKPLIAGDYETVESEVKTDLKLLEDEVSDESVKKDLFRHLTPSQQNEIGEDVNGNLFYTSPLYPVKKINGVWSVYLPNEGWYDVKDID